MTASIEFFPVGDGDMTLIRLSSGKTILIDINIRKKADQENEENFPDVATMLKDRLDRDDQGNLFVDVFMLSHPDSDHIAGLTTHFHLGSPSQIEDQEDNEGEKILIREMWSSPLTFRRVSKVQGELSENAQEWRKEAKRRVELYRKGSTSAKEYGNFIRVLGEDIHHEKTEGIEEIILNVGSTLNQICGAEHSDFSMLLLSPQVVCEEEAENLKGKNNSSIVTRFSLFANDTQTDPALFLTGGDAEIDIWKRVLKRNEDSKDNLSYDIFQTPHHCSLGALSYDKYNDHSGNMGKGEDCEIDEDAYTALSQAREGAIIIASSSEPEYKSGKGLASRKYQALAAEKNGVMKFTMIDSKDEPLKITISEAGPTLNPPGALSDSVPDKPTKGRTERSYA